MPPAARGFLGFHFALGGEPSPWSCLPPVSVLLDPAARALTAAGELCAAALAELLRAGVPRLRSAVSYLAALGKWLWAAGGDK